MDVGNCGVDAMHSLSVRVGGSGIGYVNVDNGGGQSMVEVAQALEGVNGGYM